jgi:adenine-specific DNA-methyltransferase
LEPVFFEVLNKPAPSRSDTFVDKPFSLIPYLNGGLFSPHDEDFYKRQKSNQSIYQNTLIVPDEWFRELFQILEL